MGRITREERLRKSAWIAMKQERVVSEWGIKGRKKSDERSRE